MNLLILSCGTRNLLVEYFKKCFDQVVGTDCSPLAPALYVCTSYYIVPEMNTPQYLPVLLDICKKEEINAVLPLQEDELLLIAKNKDLFESQGVKTIVSDEKLISLCRDKFEFYKFLLDNDLPTLKTWRDYNSFCSDLEEHMAKFPVFVKPRDGMGSEDIGIVFSLEDLRNRCEGNSNLLIQEYCDGEEYGADIYCDLQTGNIVDISVKKKIRMRAGETEKAVSVENAAIEDLIMRAVKVLKPIGEIDMDLFYKDNKYFISEVNPRFGGGFPHSYLYGMNTPQYIRDNLEGKVCTLISKETRKIIYTMKYSNIVSIQADHIETDI